MNNIYIHWKICKYYNIETLNKLYEHKPLLVVDTPKMIILLDLPRDWSDRTDRTIQANKPDILIKHKQNKTYQLIDMGMPSDSNVSSKELGKLSRHKDLEIETAKIWKMKTIIIPVIVRALGMIKKGT